MSWDHDRLGALSSHDRAVHGRLRDVAVAAPETRGRGLGRHVLPVPVPGLAARAVPGDGFGDPVVRVPSD